MEEFLIKNYTIITHLVEVSAALAGVFVFNKYKKTNTKYFIYFLIYLTVCDFISGYTTYVRIDRFLEVLIGTVFQKNHWWATLTWKIGAIMFFAFYYRKILKNKIFKDIIKFISYSFLLFSVIYIAFNWNLFFYTFFPAISIFGALVIFVCTVLYFMETLQSDRILSFYKSINFYITAAIFIWWLIITPIVFYDVYYTYEIGSSNRDINYRHLRMLIYISANIFMYLTFTFALIWCRPEKERNKAE